MRSVRAPSISSSPLSNEKDLAEQQSQDLKTGSIWVWSSKTFAAPSLQHALSDSPGGLLTDHRPQLKRPSSSRKPPLTVPPRSLLGCMLLLCSFLASWSNPCYSTDEATMNLPVDLSPWLDFEGRESQNIIFNLCVPAIWLSRYFPVRWIDDGWMDGWMERQIKIYAYIDVTLNISR